MRIAECGLRNVDPSIRSVNACFKMGSRNRAQGLFRVSHLKIHIPDSAITQTVFPVPAVNPKSS